MAAVAEGEPGAVALAEPIDARAPGSARPSPTRSMRCEPRASAAGFLASRGCTDAVWTAAAIEQRRLATIAAAWRLTAARRAPLNSQRSPRMRWNVLPWPWLCVSTWD